MACPNCSNPACTSCNDTCNQSVSNPCISTSQCTPTPPTFTCTPPTDISCDPCPPAVVQPMAVCAPVSWCTEDCLESISSDCVILSTPLDLCGTVVPAGTSLTAALTSIQSVFAGMCEALQTITACCPEVQTFEVPNCGRGQLPRITTCTKNGVVQSVQGSYFGIIEETFFATNGFARVGGLWTINSVDVWVVEVTCVSVNCSGAMFDPTLDDQTCDTPGVYTNTITASWAVAPVASGNLQVTVTSQADPNTLISSFLVPYTGSGVSFTSTESVDDGSLIYSIWFSNEPYNCATSLYTDIPPSGCSEI